MNSSLQPLTTPFQLGSVRLPNRFVMAPMTRRFSPGGVPGTEVAAYYRRRVEGGAGLIITEGVGIRALAAVDKSDIPHLYGEDALSGWRTVVREVHDAGGVIFPQLWHQGVMRESEGSDNPDVAAISPSGFCGPLGAHSLSPEQLACLQRPSRSMTISDIDQAIAAYAEAAANAMEVGFDGVALHGGHGYLIDNFLWQGTNQRDDEWGGDIGRRSRFAVEVVKAVRRVIGPAKPIVFRFSQWRMQDYRSRLAASPQELKEILTPIAEAGVDVFDASVRFFDTPAFAGSDLGLAGWVKRLTGKPVMAVGGIGLNQGFNLSVTRRTEADASDNLQRLMTRFNRGEFDLVAIGRSLLSDPEWPQKVLSGEPLPVFDPEKLRCLA